MARKPTDIIHLKLRFEERLRRLIEREATRRDSSMNSEIIRRLEQSFEEEERARQGAELEKALVTHLASMSPEQRKAALIGLAALGGPMGRQMSMAAIRTEQGGDAALDWLGMAHGKSDEELWEAVRAKIVSRRERSRETSVTS